jgi:ABC-type dipeptide/oligopeptide/nickel transport system permease component
MVAYVARRIGVSLIQLLGVALFAFALIHFVPGNPVATMLGPRATQSEIARASASLGLNRPLPLQFWLFLGHLVTFHFGQSITFSQSISSLLSQRSVPSIVLISYGTIVAIVLGVPLAVISAVKSETPVDHGIRVFTSVAFSMPTFWSGLILAVIFALKLGWLPISGYGTGFWGIVRSLTLPAIALGLSLLAIIVRTLRSSILHVLSLEYVEAVRARGFSTRRVLAFHVIRNAVMPTVTVLAVSIGFLIGGTVVLEQVFQIPGLGSLLFQAVEQRDYPVVETLAVLAGSLVVLLNLGTDLLQASLDPRVRPGVKSV